VRGERQRDRERASRGIRDSVLRAFDEPRSKIEDRGSIFLRLLHPCINAAILDVESFARANQRLQIRRLYIAIPRIDVFLRGILFVRTARV